MEALKLITQTLTAAMFFGTIVSMFYISRKFPKQAKRKTIKLPNGYEAHPVTVVSADDEDPLNEDIRSIIERGLRESATVAQSKKPRAKKQTSWVSPDPSQVAFD